MVAAKSVLRVTCEGGDWEGLYVNGFLMVEGHSLDARDVLFALGIKSEDRELSDDEMDEFGGHFPQSEKELPRD